MGHGDGGQEPRSPWNIRRGALEGLKCGVDNHLICIKILNQGDLHKLLQDKVETFAGVMCGMDRFGLLSIGIGRRDPPVW